MARKKKAPDSVDADIGPEVKPLVNPKTQGPDLPLFKASVRSLVAFSVQDDAAWSFSSYQMAHEGSLAHAQLQAIHQKSGNYSSEVHLSHCFQAQGCLLEVSGRADGIFRIDGQVIVEEIKTSATPLSEIDEEFSEAHWAQGKCYAHLLATIEGLESITVRLTYYDRKQNELKSFDQSFSAQRLERFFKTLLAPYAGWALSQEKWKGIRNLSIQTLSFPYPAYRKGQKLLAYNAYRSIENEKRLFAQAPTGTGKTMGVLFPAIKALGEGKLDRIFYVTAKTTTRGIAENAYKMLTDQGLRLKVLTLTAKEKLCLNNVKTCTPDKCLFLQGYMTKAKKVVKDLLKKYDFFSRDLVSETGLRHGVCPFEMSLDMALSCDLIICDYNYVFDPRVYLRRFFQQKGREQYLILVDEAHNLFDRARGMYSAELNPRALSQMAKEIKKDLPGIAATLQKLKKAVSSFEKSLSAPMNEAGGVTYRCCQEAPKELAEPLEAMIRETEDWITSDREEKAYADSLVALFFDLLHFKNILDIYSTQFRTLFTGSKSNLSLSLLCLDPSPMLNRTMNAARSTLLFSATLSPLNYFKNILGGREEDITLRLPSPFPRENLLVVNEDRIETRYRHRERYLEAAARAIYDWAMSHKGNTMVFFPSYKYLLDILEVFKGFEGDYEILCQGREMDEPSRDAFLKEFEAFGDVHRIAFCVMGGVFGEGIDLTGDKLTHVIIVGVGLPQVSPEGELIKEYYQQHNESGFTYAYTFPGINKVLQAAGRLIRTESDRGALLLIDSRFASREYLSLLPEEWLPVPRTSQGLILRDEVRLFWEGRQP